MNVLELNVSSLQSEDNFSVNILNSELEKTIKWNGKELSVRHQKSFYPVTDKNGLDYPIHYLAKQTDKADNTFWIGLGNGKSLHSYLLEYLDEKVILLEKQLGLIRNAFKTIDFSPALKSGHLTILPVFEGINLAKNTSYANVIALKPFISLYHDICNLFNNKGSIKSHIDAIDVIMDGELLISDWYETLYKNNIAAYIYPVNSNPIQYIVKELSHPLIKRIWSINRIRKLERVAEVLKKHYFIYEIDPDFSQAEAGSSSEYVHLYSYRKSRADEYKKLGWNAKYLPIATNEKRFSNYLTSKIKYPISFIGTSMFDNALRLKTKLDTIINEKQKKLLDTFWDHQRSEPENYLAKYYADKIESLGKVFDSPGITFENIIREWSGACHRIYIVKAASYFGIQVWGDESWSNFEQKGLKYEGKAKHLTQVPAIYAQSLINLDITRIYQLDIATMRLFDVIATQRIVVSNYSTDIPTLFSNPDIPRYSTIQELHEQLHRWLNMPKTEYHDYVQGLYRQLLEKHTFTHRLKTMLNSI